MGRRRVGQGVCLAGGVAIFLFSGPAVADDLSAEEGPVADCRVEAAREALEVRCEVGGLAADTGVVLTVGTAAGVPAETWVGGGDAGSEGRATVAVAVPCGSPAMATAELVATAADGGRFRHAEDVDLSRPCMAGISGPVVWAVVVTWLGVAGGVIARGRRRRRRVTRAKGARQGARRPRAAGRRRSRGRRSRRR